MTTTTGTTDPQGLEGLGGIKQNTMSEYFGAWCIEPSRFRNMANSLNGINLVAHMRHVQDVNAAAGGDRRGQRRLYPVTDRGVAMVQLRGTMMKFASSLSGGCSTVLARRAIRQAADDPNVVAIMLVIDSPGGTVSGTMDLAMDVAEASRKKRVVAFIDDLTASAAYWVASQASRVYANSPTALVGSIGTFAVLYDQSKRAEQLGVKVHLIRAGEYKGVGEPGTAITDKHLSDVQRIVDSANDEFLKGVASGRKMGSAAIKAVADGKIHTATDAVRLGLVDAIKDFDSVLREIERK